MTSSPSILDSTLQVEFRHLLDILLTQETPEGKSYLYPRAYAPLEVARKIQLLDTRENFVHIEYPGSDIHSEYLLKLHSSEAERAKDKAIVWEIGDWRTSNEFYLLKKKQMRARTEAHDRRKRNLDTIVLRMKLLVGEGIEEAYLYRKAEVILDTPSKLQRDLLLKQFNITLEEI